MKTEQEIYDEIIENWSMSVKELEDRYSKLAEKNRMVFEKPLSKSSSFDEGQRTFWEAINFLDQLYIESIKEKMIIVSCYANLVAAWQRNYDQPKMRDASYRFSVQDIKRTVESSHAEDLMVIAIEDLRKLVILGLVK